MATLAIPKHTMLEAIQYTVRVFIYNVAPSSILIQNCGIYRFEISLNLKVKTARLPGYL
jgi:hypothetical protein